jgi:starvation-inducible DNA-binding protein
MVYTMEQFLSEKTGIVRLLNKQLADTLDLRSQARQSYFNARGPYLQQLRDLFGGLGHDLVQITDLIAQGINETGGYAIASARSVARESGLREYPVDTLEARDQLQTLLSNYSRYELDTRNNMKAAREAGESATVLLLHVILSTIENHLWFLEAYLEGIVTRSASATARSLNSGHATQLPAWTSSLSNLPRINWSETIVGFPSDMIGM